jgi:HSP20 family protein
MTMQNRESGPSPTSEHEAKRNQNESRQRSPSLQKQADATETPSTREREGGAATRSRWPTQGQRGGYGPGPFSMMRRLSDDMDRLFGDFLGPRLFDWGERGEGLGWSKGQSSVWPEIDVHQEGEKLIVQADIPGLKKEDVSVEVRDDELCISGERRNEKQENLGGYLRSERTYGSFCRTVPLPEGAKPDTATATFEQGVLRVEIEAPGSEQSRGRRIEVR